jgi:hypothetical protein
MKRLSVSFGAFAVILALYHGPSVVVAASPPPAMEAALMEAAATVCNPPMGCPVTGFQRTEILPGIVHYRAVLQNGPGMYEKIGIHRVVREMRPGYPLKQVERIFLQHGDVKDFVGMFLPALYSANVPQDFGLAVYLAQNNVDVWGIDQAWNQVPQDLADYSFMENWGLQYQIDALRSALAVAREVRYLQGGSGDRFNLLGYSSGGITGYALLNYETQLSKKERHVQSYVSADMNYDSLDPDWTASFCNDINLYYIDALNAGEYGYNLGFRTVGLLAQGDPGGASPIFPGFTNLQVALYLGTAPLFGTTPVHYLAGVFDETGFPIGMQYVTTPQWIDFMASGFDWEPTQFLYDYSTVLCDQYGAPFDDYLADIKVPVLNWGAGGGIGPYGTATLGPLGSKETADYVVSTHPPEEIYLDFGHIDLFAGWNAPELAWPVLLEWIRAHK